MDVPSPHLRSVIVDGHVVTMDLDENIYFCTSGGREQGRSHNAGRVDAMENGAAAAGPVTSGDRAMLGPSIADCDPLPPLPVRDVPVGEIQFPKLRDLLPILSAAVAAHLRVRVSKPRRWLARTSARFDERRMC